MAAVLAASAFVTSYAQNDRQQHEDWKKKMMSEKVAFFTVKLDLSTEEAQKFWAVYNEVEKEKDKAREEVIKAYFELEKAVEAGKSEKELASLLDRFAEAKEEQAEIDSKSDEKFRKVLPVAKVAKLYLCEEEFRRQYIRRLHGGGPKAK